MERSSIELKNIYLDFENDRILDNVSLSIKDGDFVTLLVALRAAARRPPSGSSPASCSRTRAMSTSTGNGSTTSPPTSGRSIPSSSGTPCSRI